MSSDIEQVIREIEVLSPEERLRLIGRIVETMLPAVPPQQKATESDRALFRQLRGKYRDLLPPSDEVARWKRDDINLEDRRP